MSSEKVSDDAKCYSVFPSSHDLVYLQNSSSFPKLILVKTDHPAYTRVTSVRENQGESGNFKVPFLNQGKSGKIDLFGENQGKIREFHYESGKKIREFRYNICLLFLGLL